MSHWHVRKLQGRRLENPKAGKPASSGLPVFPPSRPLSPGIQPDLQDTERAAFIRALDASDLELSEWEVDFTGGMFERVIKGRPFTDPMRGQIDRLMNKYRGRVAWVGASRPTAPVRSTTREAYVPDDATALLSRGRGRDGGRGR